MARFKAEAPKAWERYREFAATLQGKSVTTSFDLAKGRAPLAFGSEYKFKQAAGMAWWWKKNTLADGRYAFSVEGVNSQYAYTLTGSAETALRIKQLTFFTPGEISATNQLVFMQERMRRALCPNLYIDNLPNLLKSPKYMITAISPDPAPGQEQALKVEYELPGPKAAPNMSRKAGFRVDPAHDWVVLDYWNFYSGPAKQKNTGQFKYDFTAKMPLLKRHKSTFQTVDDAPKSLPPINREDIVAPKMLPQIHREDIIEYDLTSAGGLDEKGFTLTAMGFPELNQAEWERQQSVAELLEDNTAFFLDNLNNVGVNDASKVFRNEDAHFSGTSSLAATPFQRFQTILPDWRFQIAENPGPGQYRYLRFAWKRTVGPGIMLQLHALPKTWHRYYAGTVSDQTKAWGPMTRVAEDPPRQWELVTRDLFQDFGPMTITGISFTPMNGLGEGYFDHIYLGRTIEDLDRVTAQRKNVVEGPDVTNPAAAPDAEPTTATPMRWKIWALAIALVSIAALILLFYAIARRGQKTE